MVRSRLHWMHFRFKEKLGKKLGGFFLGKVENSLNTGRKSKGVIKKNDKYPLHLQ